jgi:hypothetical protein
MSSPIERLLTKPIALVRREESGTEDEWGSPVLTEVITETKCYVRQRRTTDASEEGTVLSEHWEVFLSPEITIHAWDAVEMDGERYEVIGAPDQEWNARLGRVNHITLAVSRARP